MSHELGNAPNPVLTRTDHEPIRALLAKDRFFWLDLVDPMPSQIAELGDLLKWHPLLVEDLIHMGQRSKLDEYPELVLAVIFGAERDSNGVRLVEVAMVVHGSYVATIRSRKFAPCARLRERIGTAHRELDEAEIVHSIVDLLVDSTMATVDDLAADIDDIEGRLTERTLEADMLERLRTLRRELSTLRGVGVAQRDTLARTTEVVLAIPGFERGMRNYFDDVSDHAHQVVDRTNISRDVLDGAFEAYFAMLTAHQGVITQRLTLVATIFLPLTFVTGFFGQNFGWMVDNVDTRSDFLIFGVGGSAGVALLAIIVFRFLRWW